LETGAALLKSGHHVEDDLIDARTAPVQFFSSRDPVQSAKVMQAIDSLNLRFGSGCVRPAISGIDVNG
jgi:hypothetical protein